jgi:hypothetical protein
VRLSRLPCLGARVAPGRPGPRSVRNIAEGWRTGLAALDAVHHQAGNQLVDLDRDQAVAHADAIAVHVKNDARNGKTRTFVGSYAIDLQRTGEGRRRRFATRSPLPRKWSLEVVDVRPERRQR